MKGWREFYFYVCVGAGMALATSVFTMISGLFEVATSPLAILGIGLAGVFCVVIALSVAELASMFPSAPGIRTYLKAAFGDRSSLVLVYLYLIFVILIAGLESYIFAQVVGAVFPAAAPLPTVLILLAAVLTINLVGLELPRSMQMLTATLCIGTILVSAIYGLLDPAPAVAETSSSGDALANLHLLPAVMGMAVFLYMGFEWVTPLGLRPKSYQQKIPMSMPTAVIILAVTYSLFVLGASSHLTREAIQSTAVPQVLFFSSIYGSSGKLLALGLSISAIFSTFNAGLMGGSRLIFMLSREGQLPAWCGHMSVRSGTPVGAILFLGGLVTVSSIAVVTYSWELLAALIGAAIICVVYAGFMLSVIVLRRRRPKHRRPYRTPVPTAVQWLLVVLLPLMGAQTLISQPSVPWQPVVGALVCVLVAMLATQWSMTRRRVEGEGALGARRPPGAASTPGLPLD